MKNFTKIALVLVFFVPMSVFSQQQVATFENLSLDAESYYNGATDHSGTLDATERFEYQDGLALFRVYFTQTEFYEYWSGTAYSNQTDLTTADWTNFSAYANVPTGGGVEGSENYAFGYISGADTISFQCPVCTHTEISGAYFTNTTWAYHYINGTYGTGDGYGTDDYYKLIFKGLNEIGDYNGSETEFYLADFTNGNSTIIDDWTWVDLSALGESYAIEITCVSTDDLTPFYYCMDNLTFDLVSSVAESTLKSRVYPNPATDFITVENSQNSELIITDISGRSLISKKIDSDLEKIDLSELKAGIYFVNIISGSDKISEKIVVQ